MMNCHRQEVSRAQQQKIAECRPRRQVAGSAQEQQALLAEIAFWRRQA
ncbi:MAG: hypothetical protein F6K00_09685 [Leptolyngbya sp. SIOISBB]|nr:hypothetical protein [Leptolyngbya sp. SIOISBB]